jgi:redox-sensitive bicupin YhaK (pirin superfamily)
MIKHLDFNDFATSKTELINSIYHFSFGEYRNPNNINFGKLRVLNDEIIKPTGGYKLHEHRNLEILTFVIQGELTHKDSLNNITTLKAGFLQHITSGKGMYHSEFNLGNTDSRILSIWILPNVRNLEPSYNLIDTNDYLEDNTFIKIASLNDATIIINQDINLYILKLKDEKEISFEILADRQAYLVQIEGRTNINGFDLKPKDALKIIEHNLIIKALADSYILLIEMKKD